MKKTTLTTLVLGLTLNLYGCKLPTLETEKKVETNQEAVKQETVQNEAEDDTEQVIANNKGEVKQKYVIESHVGDPNNEYYGFIDELVIPEYRCLPYDLQKDFINKKISIACLKADNYREYGAIWLDIDNSIAGIYEKNVKAYDYNGNRTIILTKNLAKITFEPYDKYWGDGMEPVPITKELNGNYQPIIDIIKSAIKSAESDEAVRIYLPEIQGEELEDKKQASKGKNSKEETHEQEFLDRLKNFKE